MWSQDHGLGLEIGPTQKIVVSVLVSKSTLLVLVSHIWSWQSVADLGVLRAVLVWNLKFRHHNLINTTLTLCSKLTG